MNIFFIISLVFTICTSAIQTVLMYLYYEPAVNLFSQSAFLPLIFYWCVFALVIILAVDLIFLRKKELPNKLPNASRFVVFTSALTGFLIAALSLFQLYKIITGSLVLTSDMVIFNILAPFFGIAGAAYFLIIAVTNNPKPRVLSIFGLSAVVWGALSLMAAYFDMTTPLNCPPRIIHHIALISIMLYLLYEIRFHLGCPKSSHYFTVSNISIMMISLCAVPNIILSFIGFYSFSFDTVINFAELAIVLYIISRVISFKSNISKNNQGVDVSEK